MEPDIKTVMTELAEAAGAIMLRTLPHALARQKPDKTIITDTDLEIDALVNQVLTKAYPAHQILSEESDNGTLRNEYIWICDPVDGTLPFSLGVPISVFTLALTRDGNPVAGIIHDPFTKRTLIAEKNHGAFLNGRPLLVNQLSEVRYNPIGVSILNSARHDCTKTIAELKNRNAVPLTYPNVYMGSLVASGKLAGLFYFDDKPYDAAAVKIIVEEAGGKVTDIFGNEQRYDKPINGLIASNNLLHEQLLEIAIKTIAR